MSEINLKVIVCGRVLTFLEDTAQVAYAHLSKTRQASEWMTRLGGNVDQDGDDEYYNLQIVDQTTSIVKLDETPLSQDGEDSPMKLCDQQLPCSLVSDDKDDLSSPDQMMKLSSDIVSRKKMPVHLGNLKKGTSVMYQDEKTDLAGTSPTNHRVSLTSGMMIQTGDDEYALIGFAGRPQAKSVADGKDVWLAGEERTFFVL